MKSLIVLIILANVAFNLEFYGPRAALVNLIAWILAVALTRVNDRRIYRHPEAK